jgi:S-adenosylmethionine decarboxylase
MAKTRGSNRWAIAKIKKNSVGMHLIADLWSGRKIEDPKRVKRILIEAVKRAKNTPLEVSIHKFNPQGITGVVLLAESHIAIHSWPEFDYLAIDIFTCGQKAFPKKALDYLKKVFKPKKVKIFKIERGLR